MKIILGRNVRYPCGVFNLEIRAPQRSKKIFDRWFSANCLACRIRIKNQDALTLLTASRECKQKMYKCLPKKVYVWITVSVHFLKENIFCAVCYRQILIGSQITLLFSFFLKTLKSNDFSTSSLLSAWNLEKAFHRKIISCLEFEENSELKKY